MPTKPKVDEFKLKQIEILKNLLMSLQKHLNFDITDQIFVDDSIKNGVLISDCRDKKLKNTLSWSSNILIRVHFILKATLPDIAKSNQKEFIDSFKDKDLFETSVKILPSGFIMYVDETPKQMEDLPKKQKV